MKNDQTIRRCKKCGKAKALSDFPVYDSSSGARRHECQACNTARVEGWHTEHKAERLAKARVRYRADPSAHWTPERRARANVLAKKRLVELRTQVYERYGLKCGCCGESEPLFLTIDHVENDGKTMRKVHGVGAYFYRWLLKHRPTKGYQVLCMNCNFGKARNGGKCPHHNEGSTTRA